MIGFWLLGIVIFFCLICGIPLMFYIHANHHEEFHELNR